MEIAAAAAVFADISTGGWFSGATAVVSLISTAISLSAPDKAKKCNCKEPANLKVSVEEKDFGRRYYCCYNQGNYWTRLAFVSHPSGNKLSPKES